MAISRKVGRVAAAVGVAGVAAAVGGTIGLAAAQNPSPSTPPSSSAPPSSAPGNQPPAGAPMGGPHGPGRGGFGPGGNVVHGEFTVPKNGGGYETLETQVGKVTKVTNTSISVQSDDNFTKDYTVDPTTVVNAQRDGIGSVVVGDSVRVTATVNGSTATAVDITDTTKISASRGQWQPGRPPRPGGGSTTTTTA